MAEGVARPWDHVESPDDPSTRLPCKWDFSRASVQVVTLNHYVLGVFVDALTADAAMQAHRERHPEKWRPVGADGWASQKTTSLTRRAWPIER